MTTQNAPGSVYETAEHEWRGAVAVTEADGTRRRRYVQAPTETGARQKLAVILAEAIVVDGLTQAQLDAETPAARTYRLMHLPNGSRPTKGPFVPPFVPAYDPKFDPMTATREQRAARYDGHRTPFGEPGMAEAIQSMSGQAITAVLEGVRTGRATIP